jgi:hypothetical protein
VQELLETFAFQFSELGSVAQSMVPSRTDLGARLDVFLQEIY